MSVIGTEFIPATPFLNTFDSYFSSSKIIRLLCKYRIRYAKQRHKVHLLRDISLHPSTLEKFKKKQSCPPELIKMLPPRRAWKRINEDTRLSLNSSMEIAVESLRRTVLTTHIRVCKHSMTPPTWYLNLQEFIKRIQIRIDRLDEFPISSPSLVAMPKNRLKKDNVFRPISQYNIEDRIIIGQTAKYLTVLLDDQLYDCALAFRARSKAGKVLTHHDAIEKIISFRRKHSREEIFVSECDIKKFFDCVNHEHIRTIFDSFVKRAKEKHGNCDKRASIVFYQYLNSYAFNVDIYSLNSTGYFRDRGLPGGYFEWPEDALRQTFYKGMPELPFIGVPQGGALSCLISNLLLHNVDEAVVREADAENLAYLRFCDDMIILSTSLDECQKALSRYIDRINSNLVLIHEPQDITEYSNLFFQTKSKKPFKWAPANGTSGSAPWISFVGYQVRYDGVVRVRKTSLEKEIIKQKNEVIEVLKAVRSHELSKLDTHSRKSLRQQSFALENRLISMSVGRLKLYNYRKNIPALCWTNGFKKLSNNAIVRSQLRLLDSKRSKQLYVFRQKLSRLTKKSDKSDEIKNPTRYFGAPFSYFGFLNRKRGKSAPYKP